MPRSSKDRRNLVNLVYRYVAATHTDAYLQRDSLGRVYDVNQSVYVSLPEDTREAADALAVDLRKLIRERGFYVDSLTVNVVEYTFSAGPNNKYQVEVWAY